MPSYIFWASVLIFLSLSSMQLCSALIEGIVGLSDEERDIYRSLADISEHHRMFHSCNIDTDGMGRGCIAPYATI